MGRDVALADFNRRVSRLARACDGNIRDVVYTHASAANGDTHQHWHSWASITRKHNRLHPDRPLLVERFRKISYRLREGLLDVETRRQGKYDRKPNAQRSNVFTVHVGLAVAQGALVSHDFNGPLLTPSRHRHVTHVTTGKRLQRHPCGRTFLQLTLPQGFQPRRGCHR